MLLPRALILAEGGEHVGNEQRHLRIALIGNANVGKSAIFNQLTGLHQHVSNWPGKTVEKAEGTLALGGSVVDVVDLPGTYGLTANSPDESVSREYITSDPPDALINVVDAVALERNLFLTLELLELQPRMVIALNQVDAAEGIGLRVDSVHLSEILGVPVIPTIGTRNVGLHTLMEEAIRVSNGRQQQSNPIKYSTELEKRIQELTDLLGIEGLPFPSRWAALRLLEGDAEIERLVYAEKPDVETTVTRLRSEIESLTGQDSRGALASELYTVAHRVSSEVTFHITAKPTVEQYVDRLSLHPVVGYLVMALVIVSMFYTVFLLGQHLSSLLDQAFQILKAGYYASFPGAVAGFVWVGVIEGVVAGTTVALPYIVPFIVALSILEDTGYLARIAFLMDSAMHKIGFHGKGFIPLMLGFGCNVPACLGCRIMETGRERLICAFATSLVPCTARSIVIMGLVAVYVGIGWAAVLYIIDFLLIFGLSRLAFKVLPGEPTGLIMDMPRYRRPSLDNTMKKAWANLKEFVYTAFPLIIVGNFVIQLSNVVGLLSVVQSYMSPVTVLWLGLPAVTGIVLIFGILRKEMTMILLASLMGTTNFALIMSPVQMFVFAFVVMIYVPCIATIAVLAKEFGLKRAAIISIVEVLLAIALGGILHYGLLFLGFS